MHAGDASEGGRVPSWAPALLFVLVAVIVGVDLASDASSGTPLAHLLAEAAVLVASALGTGWLGAQIVRAVRETQSLRDDLRIAREDAVRWRSEAQTLLAGLGEAIHRQFQAWAFSRAEAEIALLLLEGPLAQGGRGRPGNERANGPPAGAQRLSQGRRRGAGRAVGVLSRGPAAYRRKVVLDARGAGSYKPRRSAPAQVVELVDTLDSGSSARKSMEVRVLFWALQ